MPRRRDKPVTAADTSEAVLFPDGRRRAYINGATTFRMELSIENSAVSTAAPATRPDATQAAIELLRFVLGDAETDISVVARELRLSDASFLRLRRALDRLNCAQSILEAMRAEESCGETGVPMQMRRRMRDAVDLLAKGWPEDYPAGAVEWLLLDGRRH
jgi:hypothetical protein